MNNPWLAYPVIFYLFFDTKKKICQCQKLFVHKGSCLTAEDESSGNIPLKALDVASTVIHSFQGDELITIITESSSFSHPTASKQNR